MKILTTIHGEFSADELVILSKCLKYVQHRYNEHKDSGIRKTLSEYEFDKVQTFISKLP